ncbi:MAG: response regulator [bacterium]|nr:response regulator [bacterium]
MTSNETKILLVEDNPGDARMIREQLQEALNGKFTLVQADSLKACVNLLEQNDFDVIFIDLGLPDAQGLDTLVKVKAKAKTQVEKLPIIVLTGLDSEDTAIKALREGAQDYLVKGEIDARILRRAIFYAIERKRDREALRRSEEKYRLLIESMQEGIWVIDANARTTFANRRMAEMLGYTVEEMAGRHLFEFMEERDRESAQKQLEKQSQGIKEQHDFEFVKKDGSHWFALFVTSPITDTEGNFSGAIAGVLDITDRKRMEKELLKVSKLESLSLLAGGIAHDFNNILTGIMANISIARHLSKPGEEALEAIVDAEQASIRARDLIKQLLLFARGGSQVRESTSLAKLLREVTGFILTGSNIGSRFILSDDLWPIEADAGQIYQVFENLVMNAKQAMNKGGLLEIRGENVFDGGKSSPTLKPGRYVRISVKDEGEGIPEQNLARIFDPYFTTKKEGSGLGLAITFSMIKSHNGHINVESRVGKGTTFEVYLPALASDAEARSGLAGFRGSPVENEKGKILVMDDEESIRKTLGRLLGFMDYWVDFAVGGEEAIEMYRKAKESGKDYTAAIMDLTIPGKMGGREAAAIVKKMDPEARLIVSSGYADADLMTNYKSYGFASVMTKPYTLIELQKTLEGVIQEK